MSDASGKLMPDAEAPQAGRSALERLGWQAALFAPDPNRLSLMRLGGRIPPGPTLRVYRNHAFEGVASALPPFLEYAGFGLAVALGDYDDSLALQGDGDGAALVWLDFARYPRLGEDELAEWLVSRLDALRGHVDGPLLAANSPDGGVRAEKVNAALKAWAERTPAAVVLDLEAIAVEIGDRAFDLARAPITGTRLTDAMALRAARLLAFDALDRFYANPIKAVAVDLDNTLYQGVLGEDGVTGVVLTSAHALLQRAIAALAARGVLVSVVSRNEPADVEALFAERVDFPLRREHVASWQVGWGEKSQAIGRAARAFNIAPDSFLFIDDNLGELAQAGSRLPGLRLLASADAVGAARGLELYPGLPREGVAFAGRAADLSANVERRALQEAAFDEASYLEALGAELTFALDPSQDLRRLAELSRKTNQFNLALRRLSEVEVERYLSLRDRAVVHVRLADRLGDSGSVAAVFLRRDGEALVVDEFCISCRALGRKLEDLIAAEALRAGLARLGGARAVFDWRRGLRNQPALDWLSAFAGETLEGESGRQRVDRSKLDGPTSGAVTVTWTDD